MPIVEPASLTDPAGPSALANAVAWVEGAMLGGLATTVAVIAVASLGLMLLAGRVPARRGVLTILGIFILFGAVQIRAGMQSKSDDASARPAAFDPPLPQALTAPLPQAANPASSPFDPYAGTTSPSPSRQ